MLTLLALAAAKPHLIYFLADDFGYYDVSWKNPSAHTQTLDELKANGLELMRYTHKLFHVLGLLTAPRHSRHS